jgi:hypothetical protein
MGEVIQFVEKDDRVLCEGSQTPPARPFDKGSMKVNTLEWLEVVA